MKKLIALLLALMLALALAVPASAAGEDIGIIGGTDGLTYILVGEDQGTAPDTIFGTAENIDWDAIMKEMAERRTREIIGFPTFLLRIVSLPTIEWHVESGDDLMVFFVEVVLPG